MKKTVLVLAVFSSCHAVLAQSSTELDTVVVSATRVERSINDAPVRTEVLSRYELSNIHARSLKEALENIPGLQLKEIHGKSGYEASLQGLSSDQLLILIDGMPLAASTGSAVDLNQFASLDIERIEIIKGAASAQYGSSALGGVINIITREAKSGLTGSVLYDAGSYGKQNIGEHSQRIAQHHVSTTLEGGSQQVTGRVSADLRNTQGFDANPDTWVRQGDDSERLQVGALIQYQPQQHSSLSFEGQHFREDDRQWLPEDNGRLPNKSESIRRNRFNLGAAHRFSGGTALTLKALSERYQSYSYKQNQGYVPFDARDMRLDTDFASMQLDLPSGFLRLDSHQLQVGVEWRRESLSQLKDGVAEVGTDGDVQRQSYELFLQDDYFFSAQGELVLGFRVQNDADFGLHSSPKAALKYRLFEQGEQQLLLRTSLGAGYRVPNLKERHYTFDHSSLGYMVTGNPNLTPEMSISYQLGLLWQMSQDSQLDVNAFYNDVNNLIQIDTQNASQINGIRTYRYKNIDSAQTYGLETAFTTKLSTWLALTASHSFTQTHNTSTGTVLTQKPEHIARLGLDVQATERLSLILRGRYQSQELASTETREWSPAWITFDLKTNYRITPNLRAFAGIDNLTNEQRDFSNGNDFRPIVGRFVYAGFELRGGL